jgi:salicylate hydroxylase
LRIRIAGAGIAGLASAIALARAGHQVSVHEQAARIDEVGAGLQLGPNAVRALQALGVWQRLEPVNRGPWRNCTCTTPPPDSTLVDAAAGRRPSNGASLHPLPGRPPRRPAQRAENRGSRAGRHRNPHRPAPFRPRSRRALNNPPCASMAKPFLRPGHRLQTASAPPRAPAIAPRVSPRQTGDVLYRAMCPASALPNGIDAANVHMWLSPGAHVVAYAVSGGKANEHRRLRCRRRSGRWVERTGHARPGAVCLSLGLRERTARAAG